MATIINKTTKPISVPLPGGKRLRLAPRQSAEVRPKAVDHPAVKSLVEAGSIAIAGKGRSTGHSGVGRSGKGYSVGGQGPGGSNKSGK